MIHTPFPYHNRKNLACYIRRLEFPEGIIVCESAKFIYMKSAKTAGTSILHGVLNKHFSDIIHFKMSPEEFNKWLEKITDQMLEEYFIFSFVRNPWDRLISIASYFQIPFRQFVHNLESYQRDYLIRVHSFPLTLYTHHQGNQFVDFIGRVESLQADFNLICDRIGIDRTHVPRSNRSLHRHYSRYYSEKEIEIVAKRYKDDITYLGYTFEAQLDLRERIRMLFLDYKTYIGKRYK